MRILNNLKISLKLAVLIGLFIIGFTIFGLYSFNGLDTVKVNGSIYSQIIQGKDLIADILPPPEYIIESYLNCLEMIDALDANAGPSTISQLIEKAGALRQDYDTRHKYWLAALPQGKLRQQIVEISYNPAQAFFDIRDTIFIPAIRAGDLTKAKLTIRTELFPKYLEHRKAIDQTVQTANELNLTIEQSAANLISSTSLSMVLLGSLIVFFTLLMGFVITRSITMPLTLIVQISRALAIGDLGRNLSNRDKDLVRLRQDEIGEVGKAFDVVIQYLQETGDAATAIAQNDLTISVQQMSDKDELRIAFSKMVESLRDSLTEVSKSANSLGAASAHLTLTADQAGQASSQIAMTIQQVSKGIIQEAETVTRTSTAIEKMTRAIDGVARGAQEQAQAAQKASTVTKQIDQAIQQVTRNAQSVTQEAGQAFSSATDGANKVKLTLQGMEGIRSKVGLSAEKVAQMGRHSEQITVIVETIEDIASQTNLLALNAAIEAARAGEHGKGFAVVADEVRKLAEKAASATKEIGLLIRGIQTTVKEAVSAMEDGSREVESGVSLAKEAGSALESIIHSIEAVSRQAAQAAAAAQQMSDSADQMVSAVNTVSMVVEKNTLSTKQMAVGSDQVSQAIENIASVSEENSAAVEQVSAATEEMSAQVDDVSALAKSMEDMAQTLQDLVARFRLTDETN